jgi:hypothetical protein
MGPESLLPMMSNTTTLSNTLPSSVPKLEPTRTNWTIFTFHFKVAVTTKGHWDHFDETNVCPVYMAPTTDDTVKAAQWDKDEMIVKWLLTQKIPNSTLMHIHGLATVTAMWSVIKAEYTEKGAFAQMELRMCFLESKCPDKTAIWEFLDSLCAKKEELVSVGVIDKKDYRSTIISSLPESLANFTSNQLTTAKLFSPMKTIDLNVLISIICEESECQKTKCSGHKNGRKGRKDNDEAMAVTVEHNKD